MAAAAAAKTMKPILPTPQYTLGGTNDDARLSMQVEIRFGRSQTDITLTTGRVARRCFAAELLPPRSRAKRKFRR